MRIEDIARVAHEVNAAYCRSFGDYSHVPWGLTERSLQESVIDGVKKIQENPTWTPESSHENWREFKRAQGWTYGPTKNAELKLHPCMCDWEMLPERDRIKDTLFVTVVRELSDPLQGLRP